MHSLADKKPPRKEILLGLQKHLIPKETIDLQLAFAHIFCAAAFEPAIHANEKDDRHEGFSMMRLDESELQVPTG
jgi:hypothetical protein